MKEISLQRADALSAHLKRYGYTSSKTVISIKQDIYQQMQYRKLFMVNSFSPKMLERLRALSTLNSRTVNYSNVAVDEELHKILVPLEKQLIYNEKYPSKITTSANGWLARLSAEQPAVEYASLDVPITRVQIIVTYLNNCNYLPTQSCSGYELVLQCDELGVNSCK